MADSEDSGEQIEPPVTSDQESSDAVYTPTEGSAEYTLEKMAEKHRKMRKYLGPASVVLGGIVIAVPNKEEKTTSYVAGGLVVGAGLTLLIFPSKVERALEDMRLIQDPQEREQMAYQWLEEFARDNRIGRYTFSAVVAGCAAYEGTQENYVGVGVFSALTFYLLLSKSGPEKVFEELKEGKDAAWMPDVIADIGPNRAGIKLNYRF